MADLAALQTFIAAARSGSFAAAARQLGISPAMVGRRIQALEERYASRLIERTTRSQRLTELGSQFLARAEAVIAASEELDELAQPETAPLSGRIRLSGPTTIGIKRLPAIIARFSAAHPDVVVEMNLTDRKVDLVDEGYDMAVRIGDLQPSTMIARRVGTYRFVCCAAPEHLQRFGTPRHPDDLAEHNCVLNLNLIPRNRWPFLKADGTLFTVAVLGKVEIDNGESQRAAALAGAGIICSPLDLVTDDLASGALVQVLADWALPTRPIYTIHPSRRLVPRRVTAFIEAVAEGLRDS